MAQTAPTLVVRSILGQTLREFLLLPLWWYTKGALLVWGWIWQAIKNTSVLFGLTVWVKNLFVPMYGETGFSGRAISFFIRLFMIIGKGIGVAVWSLLLFIAFIIYLLFLPFALFSLLTNIFGPIFV